MAEIDPYAVLGVPRTATREEIARAYRALARRHHPDAGAPPSTTMARINEAALQMLEEIGDASKVGEFIRQVKDKNSGVRLMGFGHRVYKNYDPRAKLMRETCHEVLNELGLHNDRLFKLAMALEKIALEDDYFVSRKLYPNVDFYSGIVQRALGIPVAMFTCIFSLARTMGWIAQWQEMITDPEYRIGRPRQLYKGPGRRDVPPLDKR